MPSSFKFNGILPFTSRFLCILQASYFFLLVQKGIKLNGITLCYCMTRYYADWSRASWTRSSGANRGQWDS